MRPFLFSLDAERAHELTLTALRHAAAVGALRPRMQTDTRLQQRVCGLDFNHPVGLAAGLDKQGVAVRAWPALGFSFVEIGTVTPAPQPGNPRPRLFRLIDDHAIINRFGFNSAGAVSVAKNLNSGAPAGLILGLNVGKNKDTPNERAAEDCVKAVEALHPLAHYFVVNVSSPNTERLRDLQEGRALRALIERVTTRVRELRREGPTPVLVKVSPDAAPDDLLHSVDAAVEGGAAGVIATNTTVSRAGLRTRTPVVREAGGLSGTPLKATAHATCALLFRHLRGRIPVVGVGGIFTADDAYARIRAGATLVQVYTALIYEGPAVVHRIVHGLGERVSRDGFRNIQEAIGIDAR